MSFSLAFGKSSSRSQRSKADLAATMVRKHALVSLECSYMKFHSIQMGWLALVVNFGIGGWWTTAAGLVREMGSFVDGLCCSTTVALSKARKQCSGPVESPYRCHMAGASNSRRSRSTWACSREDVKSLKVGQLRCQRTSALRRCKTLFVHVMTAFSVLYHRFILPAKSTTGE